MAIFGKRIVEERAPTYGETWSLSGRMITELLGAIARMAKDFPECIFCWLMIQNKLLRILTSPRKLDHWVDISGYAEIIVKHLSKSEERV